MPQPWRVAHSPFVYIRAEPSTEAEMLAVLWPGDMLRAAARRGRWLRTAEPVGGKLFGWVLEDGRPLGLGKLLLPAGGSLNTANVYA